MDELIRIYDRFLLHTKELKDARECRESCWFAGPLGESWEPEGNENTRRSLVSLLEIPNTLGSSFE